MAHGKARIPTADEFNRLLTIITTKDYAERNKAMLSMSFGLGMRVGEIASLDLGDVLGMDGKILGEFTIKAQNTKTKKARTVYLTNKKVIESLRDYVKHLRSKGDVDLDAALFKPKFRDRFTGHAMQQAFAAMFKAAGLQGCRSHSGRRSFITTLHRNNVSLADISVLAGHASVKQTAEYIEHDPAKLKAVTAKGMI